MGTKLLTIETRERRRFDQYRCRGDLVLLELIKHQPEKRSHSYLERS
jgi:hypothetical protein